MSSRRTARGILSPRQLEVARLLQRGLSTAAIAREIWAEPNTVKAHTARIYRALGISSREELRFFQLEHWAQPRACANCGEDYTPVREGQRFCADRCGRAEARRIRRELSEPDRAERAAVITWIGQAERRARAFQSTRARAS